MISPSSEILPLKRCLEAIMKANLMKFDPLRLLEDLIIEEKRRSVFLHDTGFLVYTLKSLRAYLSYHSLSLRSY